MESPVLSEPCEKRSLCSLVQTLGIVKFGSFTLKSGATSSYYIDFRESLGHPKLFKTLGFHLAEMAKNLEFDLICGVPHAAVPLATSVALNLETPLLLCRKEAKDHGQKKMLEGIFSKGQNCLLIEDVITTGSSVLETAKILRNEGIFVYDCLSCVCRQQEGAKNLENNQIRLHTLFELTDFYEQA